MLLQILMGLRDQAPLVVPTVSAVVVSSIFGGACSGGTPTPPASIDITWAESAVSPVAHRVDVYENGVLLGSSGTRHVTKTVSGYVVGGPGSSFVSNWTYTVKLVRLFDSAVISTATSSPWTVLYGAC